MKLLKNILLISLVISTFAAHDAVGSDVDTRTVGNYNVAAPQDIANIQLYNNKDIAYLTDNYTLPELAKFAVKVNKAQIALAKRNGTTPPAKLTRETLSSKEKIAEYLRSQYKFSY